MLSMEADPEDKFHQAQKQHQELKAYFSGSDDLALAAFMLTDYDCPEEHLSRGKKIYRMMKDEHPFLTSSEDSFFAVLMAWSNQMDEAMLSDMESCYKN